MVDVSIRPLDNIEYLLIGRDVETRERLVFANPELPWRKGIPKLARALIPHDCDLRVGLVPRKFGLMTGWTVVSGGESVTVPRDRGATSARTKLA